MILCRMEGAINNRFIEIKEVKEYVSMERKHKGRR